MDKRIIAVIIVVAIAVAAVLLYVHFTQSGRESPLNIENVGGQYNVTLSFWEDHAEMEYTDEYGEHTGMYFADEMRSSMDWIKNNTADNATFLCWWDYGHMIKGYERENLL